MPGPDNLFNKFKEKSEKAGHQMNLAARIVKLNVEIKTQRSEKERHFKNIGGTIHAIFAKNKQLDGKVVQDEISNELSLIERIDKHIEELHQEISKLQAEFRNVGGNEKDIVDASEVTDTTDDA